MNYPLICRIQRYAAIVLMILIAVILTCLDDHHLRLKILSTLIYATLGAVLITAYSPREYVGDRFSASKHMIACCVLLCLVYITVAYGGI